eukprot:3391001-Prorocentrum_lima.AAC.1
MALPKHYAAILATAKMEAINDIRSAVGEDAERAAWLAFLLFDKFMWQSIGANGSMNQRIRDRLQ